MMILVLGGLAWGTIVLWLTKATSQEDIGRAVAPKLARALRYPGYLVIASLAFTTMVSLFPAAVIKASWVIAADVLFQLSLVLLIGETFFAIGIDYYLRVRRQTEIPSIFEQLFKGLIYVVVALSFLSTTYSVDITPLLTTSAVFTMVIGLALQDVLGNLFSGLSVHISPPFRIGDWVEVGGFKGRVIQSNWRATTLLTPLKTNIILPNNVIAKQNIINWTIKQGLLFLDYEIGLSYASSPEQVRNALLGACQQVPEILSSPPPKIFMEGYNDFTIGYRIRVWFRDYCDQFTLRDQLTSRIWYRLKREGITIPFPIRDVFLHPEKDNQVEQIDRRFSLLSEVDLFKNLDRRHKAFLAERLQEFWFEAG